MERAEPKKTRVSSFWANCGQIFFSFLIGGLGTVYSYQLLSMTQSLCVFIEGKELVLLATNLLGMKGNLAMTLASRLSAHAKAGHMKSPKELFDIVIPNLALMECQAIVVGLLASAVAIFLPAIYDTPHTPISLHRAVLLCTISLSTTLISNLLLGFATVVLILVSAYININPENVVISLVTGLCDISTVFLLSQISVFLCNAEIGYMQVLLMAFFALYAPFMAWDAYRNEYTKEVLCSIRCWFILMISLFVSNVGGLLSKKMVERFQGFTSYGLIINEAGQNLVAMHASIASTSLFIGSHPELVDDEESCLVFVPRPQNQSFFVKYRHRILTVMVIPGHIVFLYLNDIINGHGFQSLLFVTCFLIAAIVQVGSLLYVISLQLVSHWMWSTMKGSVHSTIPLFTALADALGTIFLAIIFSALSTD